MVRLLTAAVCVAIGAGSAWGVDKAQIRRIEAEIRALRRQESKDIKSIKVRYDAAVARIDDGAERSALRRKERADLRAVEATYNAKVRILEARIRQLAKAGSANKLKPKLAAKPKLN